MVFLLELKLKSNHICILPTEPEMNSGVNKIYLLK